MFLQDAPPNTSAYMIAGYVLFAVILAIYLGSLLVRTRNLHQDLATLDTRRKERSAAESKLAPPKRKSAPAKTRRSGPPRRKPVRKK